jgi:hypothetical protein
MYAERHSGFWAGHVTGMREKRKVYRILVGKPDGETVLSNPRRRWEDNITRSSMKN